MQDLSHGVIRIDSEEKLSVLTLQDVGLVMPGGETGTPEPGLQNQEAERCLNPLVSRRQL